MLIFSIGSAVIPPPRRWPSRRSRHQQRQRKADATRDQQRAERIIPHGFRHGLRTIAKGLAAVLIGILGVADGGISGVAPRLPGLAQQVPPPARRPPPPPRGPAL